MSEQATHTPSMGCGHERRVVVVGYDGAGPCAATPGSSCMHYAFDLWLTREFPTAVFERYADDVVIHCITRAQAGKQATRAMRDAVARQPGYFAH